MAPEQLSFTCSHPTSFQSDNVLTILDQDISREVKNYEFLCESKGSLVVKLWTFNAFFSQILKENLGIGYIIPVTAILKFPNSRTHFEVSVQIPLKFWNATDRTRICSLNKFTSTWMKLLNCFCWINLDNLLSQKGIIWIVSLVWLYYLEGIGKESTKAYDWPRNKSRMFEKHAMNVSYRD